MDRLITAAVIGTAIVLSVAGLFLLLQSSDIGRLKICELNNGRFTSFLVYNKTTGEVLAVEAINQENIESSVRVGNKIGGQRTKIIVGRENITADTRIFPSRDKMFINLTALNEFGLLVGVDTECRYPE